MKEKVEERRERKLVYILREREIRVATTALPSAIKINKPRTIEQALHFSGETSFFTFYCVLLSSSLQLG